jgi:transcriptional regulator with XRE-family HTH domain
MSGNADRTNGRARHREPVQDSFGPALKKARRIRHLTLNELAANIGCSPSALSKIENQKAAPSFGMVYRICQALRMDVTTLLETPTPPQAVVTKAGRHAVYHTTGMEFQMLRQATPEHRVEVNIVDIAPGFHSGEPIGTARASCSVWSLRQAQADG